MAEKYLKLCEDYTGTWRFLPKRKDESISVDDIERKMFTMGLEEGLYGILFKIPGEYPADNRQYIDVLEPEQTVKLLCQYLRWKVYDENGDEVPLDSI